MAEWDGTWQDTHEPDHKMSQEQKRHHSKEEHLKLDSSDSLLWALAVTRSHILIQTAFPSFQIVLSFFRPLCTQACTRMPPYPTSHLR